MIAPVWRVVPFDKKIHARTAFSSGATELDDYIRRSASQDMARDVTRLFVVADPETGVVLGYYSLSAASFAKAHLPPEPARRLPHYPVPAALLDRLAVDQRCQKQRLSSKRCGRPVVGSG